jgi:hypothetical protein
MAVCHALEQTIVACFRLVSMPAGVSTRFEPTIDPMHIYIYIYIYIYLYTKMFIDLDLFGLIGLTGVTAADLALHLDSDVAV